MKTRTTFSRFIASLFAIALLSGLFAYADNGQPLPPANLKAGVTDAGNNAHIYLKWLANDEGPRPQYFYIYMATNAATDMNMFRPVTKVEAKENTLEYSHYLQGMAPGIYTFYVTSFIVTQGRTIESLPSNKVTVKYGGGSDEPYVKIASYPPIEGKVGQPWAYQLRAYSNVNCPVKFELMEKPDGMELDNNSGVVKWVPRKTGDYPVAIKAYLSCDMSNASTVQKFVIKVAGENSRPGLEIVSKPVTEVKVGQVYNYHVLAKTSTDCPVYYMLPDFCPDGMQIDKNTGLISWKPAKAGLYKVQVIAYSECNGLTLRAEQTFSIHVFDYEYKPEICAHITGMVIGEDGRIIPNGYVTAFMLGVNTNRDRNNVIFRAVIENGKFNIGVPKGAYMLMAEAKGYMPSWYENAEKAEQAKPFNIDCGQTLAVRFILKKIQEPTHHMISGFVLSADEGKPVPSIVEFTPAEALLNKEPVEDDMRFRVMTDAHGRYEIMLPDKFTWIAHAIPVPTNSSVKKYMDQFWEGRRTPFEADKIKLDGDRKDINFRLLPFETHQTTGFTGRVVNADLNPVRSLLIAFCIKPDVPTLNLLKLIRITISDNNGYFKYENMLKGKYLLFSLPLEKAYIPGFYKQNSFVTLNWMQASLIGVGDNMTDMIYLVKHPSIRGLKGIAKLSGSVSGIDNTIDSKDGNKPQCGGEALAGAFVYFLDQNGNVSTYAMTDSDGSFTINGIPQGEGTLVIDYPGYNTYERPITFDYNEKVSDLVFAELTKSGDPLSTDELPGTVTNGVQLYPNPAVNNTVLKFNAPAGTVDLSIYNVTGGLMKVASFESTGGSQAYGLDVSGLPAGVYTAVITMPGQINTSVKLSITR